MAYQGAVEKPDDSSMNRFWIGMTETLIGVGLAKATSLKLSDASNNSIQHRHCRPRHTSVEEEAATATKRCTTAIPIATVTARGTLQYVQRQPLHITQHYTLHFSTHLYTPLLTTCCSEYTTTHYMLLATWYIQSSHTPLHTKLHYVHIQSLNTTHLYTLRYST